MCGPGYGYAAPEGKLERAKRVLGERYVLHPTKRVRRATPYMPPILRSVLRGDRHA